MDIVSLLAPYRSKPVTRSASKNAASNPRLFQFSATNAATKGFQNAATGTGIRNFTPSSRSQNKFNPSQQTTKTVGTKQESITAGAGGASKFNAYHRKQNLKFTLVGDSKSQATKRRIDFNEGIKAKRDKAMNSKREGVADILATVRPMIQAAQSAQMEKLLRWKREKADLLEKQKQVKKPPMTVGIPQRKPNGLLDIAPKSQLKASVSSRPTPMTGIVKKNTSTSCNSGTLESSSETQKLTQQMDKKTLASATVPIASPPVLLAETKELQAPPVPEQNENENIPPKSTLSVPNIVNSPAFKKLGVGGMVRSPVASKSGSGICNSPAIKKIGTIQHSPAIKKVKKAKGMLLDAVYREFNSKFVSEATTLSDYIEKWSKFLEENDQIPEEILGDIESSIGQARLLFESKLPQFAELLYFYLSKTLNPHPVLPCDLEGWWDVAVISIEKVKDRFVKLEKLSRNRWQHGERVPLKAL